MAVVTYSEVLQAQNILKGVVHCTPVLTSHYLNSKSDGSIFLKCENFQRVGAFKFRGAYHAITRLVLADTQIPIIALSSGNHAQGVALSCQLHGLQAILVMPAPLNPLKLAAVQGYGATVHQVATPLEGERMVHDLMVQTNGRFVHAFNDPHVIAGQGTATLEFLESHPELDVLLAPVGGGGLLSGTCLAAHGVNPAIKVYACEPALALDAIHSVQENRIVSPLRTDTIAEGLRTSLGDVTLAILREHLEGFFIVEEKEIVQAMQVAFERLKIVIEPSSAVALAPVLRGESALQGKRVGVIVTGGNIDLLHFCEVCNKKQV
jgi:threonine dehydratase